MIDPNSLSELWDSTPPAGEPEPVPFERFRESLFTLLVAAGAPR
jgi:hypothetical protein